MGSTLAQRTWDAHVVRRGRSRDGLLHVGLHLLHEVNTPQAFDDRRADRVRPAHHLSTTRPLPTDRLPPWGAGPARGTTRDAEGFAR
ncbi:hypothetical protein ABT095_37465 [Kitasatospora sp. NPDC002227]|uniref:hypothetical protein n=1 Tax=Kitasatospora sp. NPDC002227 TaxID=3154773 RepID=UPI00332E2492